MPRASSSGSSLEGVTDDLIHEMNPQSGESFEDYVARIDGIRNEALIMQMVNIMGAPVDLSSVAASGSSPLGVPIGIAAGINTLGTLLGGALTQGYNRENMALQNEYAKDLMNYQWQNFWQL